MSAATPQFPTATILAYPRIGRGRELKRALEARWAGRITEAELIQAANDLRKENLARLVELGLNPSDASLADAPSLYDHVLDATILLGAIPPRFAGREGLDLYFALARGDDKVGPEEMTKWFDTNYHYLVPEIGPDTPLRFADDTITRRFTNAREWGYVTRPVLVGPVTYLALAKADPATPDFDPLTRIDEAVAAYEEALASLHTAGAPWVQLDEPALTSDNLSRTRVELGELAARVYERLAAATERPQILLTTPYGDASHAVGALAKTGVEALHVDTLRGSLPQGADLSGVTLVVGAVDGRYIWRADLAQLRETMKAAQALGAARVTVATSNSLQHVPHDTALETWDDATLNENLHAWLAFADQKVLEVVTLARGVDEGWEAIDAEVAEATRVLEQRAAAPGVVRPEVRSRTAALTDADRAREPYLEREAAQTERLHLPPLPTTTIGSFPQTTEIRKARAANARGELSDADYEARMREEIASVITLQEELGLDMLVHGEAERNDMVQYFAELLDGFAATRNGWLHASLRPVGRRLPSCTYDRRLDQLRPVAHRQARQGHAHRPRHDHRVVLPAQRPAPRRDRRPDRPGPARRGHRPRGRRHRRDPGRRARPARAAAPGRRPPRRLPELVRGILPSGHLLGAPRHPDPHAPVLLRIRPDHRRHQGPGR